MRSTRDHLLALLRKEPFEPFHFRTTNDRVFAVRHPENVMISGSTAHVYIGLDQRGHAADRMEMVPLIHVTGVGKRVPDELALVNEG